MTVPKETGCLPGDLKPANGAGFERALEELKKLRIKLPDFHFSYQWLGRLNLNAGQMDEARRVFEEGLRQARSKHEICAWWAEAEFELGDLSDAIKWWIINVIIQIGTKDLCSNRPFLYLACIARECGVIAIAERLEKLADTAPGPNIRFVSPFTQRIHVRFNSLGTNPERIQSLLGALRLLDREFLSHP